MYYIFRDRRWGIVCWNKCLVGPNSTPNEKLFNAVWKINSDNEIAW